MASDSVYGMSVSVSSTHGPSARSGATAASPSAVLPVWAMRMCAVYRPRTGTGTTGLSGKGTRPIEEVISSPTSAVHSSQVRRASVTYCSAKYSPPP